MKSSLYVALALFVTVVIADDSRSKKDAIYNPYGQITDANKYLATAHPAHVYNNNYQQVPYNGYQPAAYSAYNQLQYYQQQPYQRVGEYPYNVDTATTGYNQYNNYPYSGGFQQYPYNVNQHYPYNVNQQYPYNVNQQYPYNVNQLQYGAYQQQQYPYFGYQNAYGRQQIPFGYNNNYNAYNFNQVVRQAPAYPSAGAQPVSPPVPHPFYHTQGTYYPTEINKPTAPAPAATVEPPKKP
uniref:Uncharacterized protein n=1 Tax=Schizaphis graminum TaxID=13262 RepID=A0A2S2NYE8_SCHGA